MRFVAIILFGWVAASCGAATLQENFSTDPAGRGWAAAGDASLFRWNPANQNLEVTWDSSRTNSYFHRRLGTILAKDDDFSFAFDLRLDSVAVGIRSNKVHTFELAVGLVRLASATAPHWQRGTGINALNGPRHLMEFAWFPDTGFGATVSPTAVSSNNQFATTFNFPLDLDPGAWFRVSMAYTSSNRTLRTTMTRNGAPFGPVQNVILPGSFTDFRLDHFAICSYSDAGSGGSILAHGIVDNVAITTPGPAVEALDSGFIDGAWSVHFASRTNWVYTLERTTDFQSWADASNPAVGNGAVLPLQDANPPEGRAFYRVRADRP